MRDSRKLWAVGGILAAAVVALIVVFQITHAGAVVAVMNAAAPTAPAPSAAQSETPPAEDKGVVFSDEFRLDKSSTNLEIQLNADVSNAFVGVDGALVNLDSGAVDAFALSAEQWHGVEDGESWTEGSRNAAACLGALPAGRYALRVDAEAEPQDKSVASIPYSIVARSEVPSPGRGFLLVLLLLLPPAIAAMLRAGFETRRWSESDHPPGGAS